MAASDWQLLGFLILGGLTLWLAFRMVRGAPALFTKANFSKTVTTTGVVALMLIVIVALCVLVLRS